MEKTENEQGQLSEKGFVLFDHAEMSNFTKTVSLPDDSTSNESPKEADII